MAGKKKQKPNKNLRKAKKLESTKPLSKGTFQPQPTPY
jgi:hypothetical protein